MKTTTKSGKGVIATAKRLGVQYLGEYDPNRCSTGQAFEHPTFGLCHVIRFMGCGSMEIGYGFCPYSHDRKVNRAYFHADDHTPKR